MALQFKTDPLMYLSKECVWPSNFSNLLYRGCKPNFFVAPSLCQPWAEAPRWLYMGGSSLGLILTPSLGLSPLRCLILWAGAAPGCPLACHAPWLRVARSCPAHGQPPPLLAPSP